MILPVKQVDVECDFSGIVWSRSVGKSAKLIPHSGRGYGTDTSRQRHDHARHPSRDTAIEGSAQRSSRAARS